MRILYEQQQKKEFSPEFWAWFGDSKVVDKEGNPLLCYHGTNANRDFSSFKTLTHKEIGAHFGTRYAANCFVDDCHKNARIFPVYLSIQNPIEMPDVFGYNFRGITGYVDKMTKQKKLPKNEKFDALKKYLSSLNINTYNFSTRSSTSYYQSKRVFKMLQDYFISLGYDGISYVNLDEDPGSTSYIIFHPYQVKSAVANKGSYSKDSGDISEGTEPDVESGD